jgi:uncharacterized membrane protein
MISFPWHRVPTRFADFVHESAWFLPAVAASIGVAAGVATTSADYEPVLGTVRVTVDRERDTLVAALALLFTGLSIVLSVGLSSIQNVANRFSLRLMSVILRGLETRLVVSVFVVALALWSPSRCVCGPRTATTLPVPSRCWSAWSSLSCPGLPSSAT